MKDEQNYWDRMTSKEIAEEADDGRQAGLVEERMQHGDVGRDCNGIYRETNLETLEKICAYYNHTLIADPSLFYPDPKTTYVKFTYPRGERVDDIKNDFYDWVIYHREPPFFGGFELGKIECRMINEYAALKGRSYRDSNLDAIGRLCNRYGYSTKIKASEHPGWSCIDFTKIP